MLQTMKYEFIIFMLYKMDVMCNKFSLPLIYMSKYVNKVPSIKILNQPEYVLINTREKGKYR